MKTTIVRLPRLSDVEKIANSAFGSPATPDLKKLAANQRALAKAIIAVNKSLAELGAVTEAIGGELNRRGTQRRT